MSSEREVVAIVGTTGTGKSKLGVDLSLSLNGTRYRAGEIINADSMQVYRGLDVLTNKAPTSEMRGVPHHLMSFLDVGEDYFVERFRRDAMRKIDEIHERGNLPIVVGGTAYYVQNLLLLGNLVKDVAADLPDAGKSLDRGLACTPEDLANLTSANILSRYPDDVRSAFISLPAPLLELVLLLPSLPPISSASAFPPDFPVHLLPPAYRPPDSSAEDLAAAIHSALRTLDPFVAARWHWRDLRKVRRSLEVLVCTGKRMSQVIAEQEQRRASEVSGTPFRSLIFWLWADPDALSPRLDARVDAMSGLLDEVKDLRERRASLVASDSGNDFSRGPYQAIGSPPSGPLSDASQLNAESGFRELDAYLSSTPAASENEDKKRFDAAVDLMKLSTRQYARSQVKWMKSKFAPAVAQARAAGAGRGGDVEMFLLDATDVERWSDNVEKKARLLLHGASHLTISWSMLTDEDADFVSRRPLPPVEDVSTQAGTLLAPSLSLATPSLADRAMRVCEVCTVDAARPFSLDAVQWDQHVKSARHRSRQRRLLDPDRSRLRASARPLTA